MSVECEHRKAIYLFQVTLTHLVVPFSLEPICSKRMRRLVSFPMFKNKVLEFLL